MFCLKCGREISDDRVFCDGCLSVMERYPVKPGTTVQLPKRSPEASGKKPSQRKRALSQEDQILYLKKVVRRNRIISLVLLIALSLAAVLLVREFSSGDAPIIGQNYTINTTRNSD